MHYHRALRLACMSGRLDEAVDLLCRMKTHCVSISLVASYLVAGLCARMDQMDLGARVAMLPWLRDGQLVRDEGRLREWLTAAVRRKDGAAPAESGGVSTSLGVAEEELLRLLEGKGWKAEVAASRTKDKLARVGVGGSKEHTDLGNVSMSLVTFVPLLSRYMDVAMDPGTDVPHSIMGSASCVEHDSDGTTDDSKGLSQDGDALDEVQAWITSVDERRSGALQASVDLLKKLESAGVSMENMPDLQLTVFALAHSRGAVQTYISSHHANASAMAPQWQSSLGVLVDECVYGDGSGGFAEAYDIMDGLLSLRRDLKTLVRVLYDPDAVSEQQDGDSSSFAQVRHQLATCEETVTMLMRGVTALGIHLAPSVESVFVDTVEQLLQERNTLADANECTRKVDNDQLAASLGAYCCALETSRSRASVEHEARLRNAMEADLKQAVADIVVERRKMMESMTVARDAEIENVDTPTTQYTLHADDRQHIHSQHVNVEPRSRAPWSPKDDTSGRAVGDTREEYERREGHERIGDIDRERKDSHKYSGRGEQGSEDDYDNMEHDTGMDSGSATSWDMLREPRHRARASYEASRRTNSALRRSSAGRRSRSRFVQHRR